MADFEFKPIDKTVIEKSFGAALLAVEQQLLNDCNQYVRVDQGTLRDTSSATTRGMETTLKWDTPYAKRVYYTGTPSKDKNPNASIMWAEKAAKQYGNKSWKQLIEKCFAEALR